MTDNHDTKTPPPTGAAPARGGLSRIYLVLPFVGLALVALFWTGFWFQARSTASEAMAAWRAAEAADGRTYSCGRETLGGFPFRFEFRCIDLVATIRDGAAEATFRAPRLAAVAQAYDLTHLIFQADGPIAVSEGGRDIATLGFESAQASLNLDGDWPERAALVIAAPDLTLSEPLPEGAPRTISADKWSAYLRRKPDGVPGRRDYDIALESDALVIDNSEDRWNAKALADLFALPNTSDWGAAFLKDWQAADGRLGVTQVLVTDGTRALESRGALALTETGRLNGTLAVGVTGFNSSVGDSGDLAATALSALGIFGRPGPVNGSTGRVIDLAITNGVVAVGPVSVFSLPPLF